MPGGTGAMLTGGHSDGGQWGEGTQSSQLPDGEKGQMSTQRVHLRHGDGCSSTRGDMAKEMEMFLHTNV